LVRRRPWIRELPVFLQYRRLLPELRATLAGRRVTLAIRVIRVIPETQAILEIPAPQLRR
jgi:hypothetical protein